MPSPGLDVQSWSHTPITNGSADPSINFLENQARASLNDSMRAVMAAIAIDRDLNNGSITTGGTAAAQTFASGASYTSMPPTGFRCTLTMGFTNPGAFTLNMDGIGAKSVKTTFGGDPDVGVFIAGMYLDFIWNGTNFIVMPSSQSADPAHAGQLTAVSSTLLKFAPYSGNKIKINGLQYVIPNAGIAGLANTGVFVNGTGGQNLAASTFYYIYAFNNSGVITGDFRTDGNGHITDTTAGNEGIEVRCSVGTTPDATRSLIGICYTDGSSHFQLNNGQCFIRSWYHRNIGQLYVTFAWGPTGSIPLVATMSVQFIGFTDDEVVMTYSGAAVSSSGSPLYVYHGIGVDALVLSGPPNINYHTLDNSWYSHSVTFPIGVVEGVVHTVNGLTAVTQGTVQGTSQLAGRVLGHHG